jgi:large repetitive protein
MRKVVVALLFLFPMIAAAQSITISPDRIAYNTEGAIMTISGTGLAGNVTTLVDFTFGDGGVAEVTALTASSSTVTAEVPLSVTGLPGAWAVTVVAVDDNGTRVAGPATLTIFANLPPLITVPEVVTAEATSGRGANVDFDVSGFSFVDPPPAPTITCTPPSGSNFVLGSTIVTCTATDSFGSSHASFTVFVGDTTPPVITVPAPITSETSVVTYTVSALDAVDGSVAVSCSPASGSTFPTGVTTVQCSATDAHDNTAFASFQVSVGTPPAPTLTLPANFTVIADDNVGITVAYVATANQEATVVCSPESGSFFPIGATTVNCTATNAFGVSSTGSFTIAVLIDPRPTLILPADITVDATSASGAVVTYTATATDSVDGTIAVTCTPLSGATFPIGTTTVQCSATNSRGFTRFGSFAVNVRGSALITLTLPAFISVPGTAPTVVTWTATAISVVDGSVPVTCTPPSGSTFDLGTTPVTCTASDSTGNTATGSFNVTVGDTTPPDLVVPDDITVEATSPSGAVVMFTAAANDNADGPLTPVCSPASGSTFGLGTTTVTCTATDSRGNSSTATFHVTVRDTTPPTLHLPSPITVSADAACVAVVTYTATATDLVDVTDPVVCSPASGSTFNLGTTTVNCSSTDAHGNTATGSFTVTVNDTTPPTIRSLTPSLLNIWPVNHKMVDVTIAADVVDNCDTAPVTRIVSITANQPILGPGSGNTTPDYIITGDLTVTLRAERTGNLDRIYTLTVTSTDVSGNTSTSTVLVYVSQTNNGG